MNLIPNAEFSSDVVFVVTICILKDIKRNTYIV